MSTLLSDSQHRAEFQSSCAALVVRLQRLEIVLSIALGDHPNHNEYTRLIDADAELGNAARAVQAAALLVGGLK